MNAAAIIVAMETLPNKLEQISSKESLLALANSGEYLFHGSPSEVEVFEPRQAYTDIDGVRKADGEPAVFASTEIETPLFRSIFHESTFEGLEGDYELGFSNSDDGTQKIHANEAAIDVCKERRGYVYVFKKEDFRLLVNTEWVTETNVRPVAVFHSCFGDIGLPIETS